MKTSFSISTEVNAIIETLPIPMIKKEVEIKDKNIIKIKLQHNTIRTTSETYEFKVGTF